MPKILQVISLLALVGGCALAQSTTRPKYLDRAIIKHGPAGMVVVANAPIPLLQALSALRLEFGWQISWESAAGYSRFDVVDDTAPKWRAAHPDAKGVTRPSGGLFTANLPEPATPSDPNSERDVLATLIDDYNATANPGKYVLREGPDRQMTVIGVRVRDEAGALQEVPPLLDTLVTLPDARRSVYDTINLILDAVQSATSKKVFFAVASSSLFMNTQVVLGGKQTAARELLTRALAGTKRTVQYELGYDPDVPVYMLGASLVMREEDNGDGGRRLVPADRAP